MLLKRLICLFLFYELLPEQKCLYLPSTSTVLRWLFRLIDGSLGENDTTIRRRRSEGQTSVVGRYARYDEVRLATVIISLCHRDAKQRDNHQRPVTTHSTWNELPVNIRASGTLPMFRKSLKTYLFIKHFN